MPDKAHYDEFGTTELRFGGKWTCTACPVQAEGRLNDGRPWYFRARHGEWSMQVGERGDEHAVEGRWVADGYDPWEGFMPAPEAAARIHSVLRWHDKPLHAATFGCTGVGDWLVDSHWRWTDAHGWRLWSACGICLASNGLREPGGCTATDAIASTAEVRCG